MKSTWLEWLSLIGIFLVPIFLVIVPIRIGERLGKAVRSKRQGIQDAPIGSLVGAALGLLAFMLAFTFQITANRFDDRKQLLLDEVSSLKKAFLQSSLLPEPGRAASAALLKEYVDLRVVLAKDITQLERVINRSKEIHQALWDIAISLAEEDRSSEVYAMFTASVGEVIDLQDRRITVALQYRIPTIIMWMLYLISFSSMLLLGFQFGVSGRGNMLIHMGLALTFAAVMWLIFALDRPEKDIISVDQTPMFLLQQDMGRE